MPAAKCANFAPLRVQFFKTYVTEEAIKVKTNSIVNADGFIMEYMGAALSHHLITLSSLSLPLSIVARPAAHTANPQRQRQQQQLLLRRQAAAAAADFSRSAPALALMCRRLAHGGARRAALAQQPWPRAAVPRALKRFSVIRTQSRPALYAATLAFERCQHHQAVIEPWPYHRFLRCLFFLQAQRLHVRRLDLRHCDC